MAGLLCLLAASILTHDATAQAVANIQAPLVSLSAEQLADGPLTEWANSGSISGSFTNDGTNPKVETVSGVKAVTFSGRDRFVASFNAPDGITGSQPWTCIVRAYNPRVGNEETLVAWAPRPNNSLQIEYGSARNFGAIGTYNDPNTLGWTNGVPTPSQWHTLTYVYTGGRDGTLRAYCDGHLQAERTATLNTKAGGAFVLGACIQTGSQATRQSQPFSGSIASVMIYDRALPQLDIWKASGQVAAFPLSPAADEVLRTLTPKLTWSSGISAAKSFDVYFGADSNAVANAENSLTVGQPADAANVFKGNQSKSEYALASLELGRKYFWRVDERDSAGKVLRGEVQQFTTDDGLANSPSPVDHWPIPAGEKPTLKWHPGAFTASQNIYFGSSADEVLKKTKPDIAALAATVSSIPFPADSIAPGKDFYWRVDEINVKGVPVTKGGLWTIRGVKKKLRVYLLGGQSNMTGCTPVSGLPPELRGFQTNVIIFATGGIKVNKYGWGFLREGLGQDYNDDGSGTFGPEVTFGHDMAAAYPGEVIALVKCGWGGTDLGVRWRPPSAGGRVGPLYRNWVAAMHEGLTNLDAAFEPEICGMIWMQGEEDAQQAALHASYETNLTCFIHDVREEFKKPNLPFALGTISTTATYDPPRFGADIRAAQLAVSQKVPHTATFPTGDFHLLDSWHYDPPGMITLGQRFAKAMLELEHQTEAAK